MPSRSTIEHSAPRRGERRPSVAHFAMLDAGVPPNTDAGVHCTPYRISTSANSSRYTPHTFRDTNDSHHSKAMHAVPGQPSNAHAPHFATLGAGVRCTPYCRVQVKSVPGGGHYPTVGRMRPVFGDRCMPTSTAPPKACHPTPLFRGVAPAGSTACDAHGPAIECTT